MSSIWVREFTGGLDSRRMPETASASVLVEASDCHVNRGGEIEKRAAFVPVYVLPAGTVGLAADTRSLVTFGSTAEPAGMPYRVRYQQMVNPDDTSAELVRIVSSDRYKGNLYGVGEFEDGSRYHFYNGATVDDFRDGRARATFEVTGGGTVAAVAASGSFELTGGTSGLGNQITAVTVGGVDVLGGAISFGESIESTAAQIAAAINARASVPYAAAAAGATVVLTAASAGAGANGAVIAVAASGNVTAAGGVLAGGSDEKSSVLAALTVGGVSIIGAPVAWVESAAGTANAIVDAINDYTSTPDYVAVLNGARVSVLAASTGTDANGKAIELTAADGLTVAMSAGLTMAKGVATSTSYVPADFVKTIGSRIHATSGAYEIFSGISNPTAFNTSDTSTTGTGFIDMSTQASGAEKLYAVAVYQNWVVVFAESVTQVWYIDSDPEKNAIQQVLNNTGTLAPKSVTQFGDADLFYLDESGLRSLRARNSSNAAATSDIGVPVDTLVIDAVKSLTVTERARIIVGLIEPRDGRFWLCVKDRIFVFSYFPGSKISAWTTYLPGFDIDAAVVFRRHVYLRSGNTIYAFGGLDVDLTYDTTHAVAQTPYLDGNDPARAKTFASLDVACQGEWRTKLSFAPVDQDQAQDGPTFTQTTYGTEVVGIEGKSTHIALRFESQGSGPAKLGAFIVHYIPDANEDGN